MPTQKFRGLLQLSIKNRSIDRLSGAVESADILLKPETLEKLDQHFNGAYAIFIHDPRADAALQAYIDGNTAAADSGRSVMVLYQPAQDAAKTAAGYEGLGLGAVLDSMPMVDFAKGLFPGKALSMPGIILLPRMSAPGNPLYVPLGAINDASELTGTVRQVLAIVASCVDTASGAVDVDAAGRDFALAGRTYLRGGKRSPAELMLSALRTLWDARKDLLAAIGGGIKLATGKTP